MVILFHLTGETNFKIDISNENVIGEHHVYLPATLTLHGYACGY